MKNRIDIKNVIAIIVIIASFLFAIGLAVISNGRSSYWMAVSDLTPGHTIEIQDLRNVKSALSNDVSGYYKSTMNPIGLTVSRFIGSGELLNQNSLTDGQHGIKLLSFAAAAPDLPSAARVGDLVNLYQVINENGNERSIPSELVIENIYIVDINRKSENLGGTSIVTVAIPNDLIVQTLNATRAGRIVVVINHG